jgi:signal transduction histidine kinase/DNA-binding response OmpR family regulator/ligand-binding sensor domain-containing protein
VAREFRKPTAGRHRTSGRALGRLVLAAAFLVCCPAAAQHLPITTYTPDDGLASSQAWAIYQDSRGFLWVGTTGGLCRWDGVYFETLGTRDGLRDQVVRTIVEDRNGHLWLGTNASVARYDGRAITNYSTDDGLADGVVWTSVVDRHGAPWFGTSGGGVSVFTDDGFRTYTTEDGLGLGQVTSLHLQPPDHLWIGNMGGGITRCRIDAGGALSECTTYTEADGLSGNDVRQIVADTEGNLYIATTRHGVSRFDGVSFEPFSFGDDDRVIELYCALIKRDGELVLGSQEEGVILCPLPATGPCRRIRRANGLPVDNIWRLYEDREGNLWIGTNNGLSVLRTEAFRSFGDGHGFPDTIVIAIHADPNGDVWLGTFGGLIRIRNPSDLYGEHEIDVWTRGNGLPASEVWEVMRDSRGLLWLGTGMGMCRFEPGMGCAALYQRTDGLADNYLLDITEAPDGNLWIGNATGFSRARFDGPDDVPELRWFTAENGFTGRMVHAVLEDHHGNAWIGTRGQGLQAFDGQIMYVFTTEDGLPDDSIICLHLGDDGTVWVGTDSGVASFVPSADLTQKPEFIIHGGGTDLHGATMAGIGSAGPGKLWMLTAKGLYLVEFSARGESSEVLAFLDRQAGLIGNEGTGGNAIASDARGRVWFGFSTGVTRYDPGLLGEPPPPPMMSLERISTRGGRVLRTDFSLPPRLDGPTDEWMGASKDLTLPYDDSGLRFDFRGLSFRNPDSVTYQWMLAGFDADWSAASGVPFKEYTNLDPGSYTFRVRARGRRGGWSEAVEVGVTVQPAFWQTPAFAVFALLAVGALVFAGHRARTYRINARNRELEESVAARTDDLKRYAQALEEHSHALDRANVRAREADRLKSEFLANMSHDLRAPLNSIIGFSEVLIPRLEGQIAERQLGFLRNIQESGHHLLQLINNLLDLSKIEAGKMEIVLEEAELRPVLEGVCSVMSGQAQKQGVSIELQAAPDLPEVVVDVPKLKQILFNLISNAIKFSPRGSSVEVVARALSAAESDLDEDSYDVAVVDNGIGISEEDQTLIFQEFRQLHKGSERPEGTGLGLAIVKRFVAALGGTIQVQSAAGEGCTFRVLLPTRPAEVSPEQLAGKTLEDLAEGPEGVRHRVLVVEDDREAFTALAGVLEEEGFLAVRAHTGEEALRMAKEIRPALVALDLVLPGLDGWSVFRALKEDPETAHLPVVIVSLHDNRQLGFALGVDAYFVKPVVGREFVETVKGLTAAPPDATPGPVLVVDDERHTRELLHETLTSSGIEVLLAATGQQGIDVALSHKPAMIVLDLMMPGMNGFEVAHRLQQDPRTASIPILVLTAKELSRADRRRLSGQVLATFGKASSYNDLLHTIRTLLERRADLD